MGLCVDPEETEHGIGFEVRRQSIKFHLADGEVVEILKTDIAKIHSLLSDEYWQEKILPND